MLPICSKVAQMGQSIQTQTQFFFKCLVCISWIIFTGCRKRNKFRSSRHNFHNIKYRTTGHKKICAL